MRNEREERDHFLKKQAAAGRGEFVEKSFSEGDFQKERKKRLHVTKTKRCLSAEIGIEYKACLYFFCFLFFYAVYRVLGGSYTADLIHLAEMICMTYGMGYLQVYALDNFDESERYSLRELLFSLLCTALYTGAGFLFGWFDRHPLPTALFAGYCMLAYAGVCLVNRLKREIDTQQLNVMLQVYQKGKQKPSCKEAAPAEADREEQNEKCH